MIRYLLLISLCCGACMANKPVVTAPAQEQAPRQTTQEKESKKKQKERRASPATITSTRNISRASVSQRSPKGYYAEFIIMDSGINIRNPQDLQMIGSSGSQTNDGSRIIFENFVVPFEGTIRFKSPNKMNTVVYERVVSFKINEAGSWVVRIEI